MFFILKVLMIVNMDVPVLESDPVQLVTNVRTFWNTLQFPLPQYMMQTAGCTHAHTHTHTHTHTQCHAPQYNSYKKDCYDTNCYRLIHFQFKRSLRPLRWRHCGRHQWTNHACSNSECISIHVSPFRIKYMPHPFCLQDSINLPR